MAGPWFVDPINGSESNNGLSADTPWKLIPGQTGATSQTGYGVVAGDTINVKNGTSTTLRIFPPANSLTYRGYGTADNVLVVNLPMPFAPWKTYPARLVREAGVHEGMWTIDATNNDVNGGALGTGVRAGCVFEDLNIIGPQVNGRAAVALASSSENPSGGVTMRRFAIRGAAGFGIIAYNKSITLDGGLIEYTYDDNLQLAASTANGSRAGGADRITRVEFRDPNRAIAGGVGDGASGDCIQLLPTTGGVWLGSLLVEDCSFFKSTEGKQLMVLHDATNGITVRRIHVEGYGTGNAQILIGHLVGAVLFENAYFSGWAANDNQLFRFNPADVSPPAYGMNTGSSLRVRNVVALGRCPGLYALPNTSGYSFDGAVEFDNVTAIGTNDSTLSYASTFALWSASDANTYGDNFTFKARNCNAQVTGKPNVIMPSGSAGSAKFAISGSAFAPGTYSIGATGYADLAAFEAAHNQATGNINADPMVTDIGVPMNGSPLFSGGSDIGYSRDIRGLQSRKHIGAFGRATLR